ncbi:hypothetical protein CNR22_09110 [Sphingobacteriaceae bacterium]|nr:hypothetical protein CNR22_09110 [Sphingobacteriaceae bacterium]
MKTTSKVSKPASCILAILFLSVNLVTAQQSANKKTTVRIVKKEIINGVEKTRDSTYTVEGAVNLTTIDALSELSEEEFKTPEEGEIVISTKKENGLTILTEKDDKVVIVTDLGSDAQMIEVDKEKMLLDDQVQRALKAANLNDKPVSAYKIMQFRDTPKTTGEKIKHEKIIFITTVKLSELNEKEAKQLTKGGDLKDQNLNVKDLHFYPNPTNGKFNLKFELADKGNTEITILNGEGILVYNEELKNFSGIYDKEIDLSKNPKGIYFVKIRQGNHSQLKKLILN